jgi:hypothetical protein
MTALMMLLLRLMEKLSGEVVRVVGVGYWGWGGGGVGGRRGRGGRTEKGWGVVNGMGLFS